MVTGVTREAYLEMGLDVLSELGYGGLKLAEVCTRLGVTTGAFYHYFPSWSSYTRELVEHWRHTSTNRLIEQIRTHPDPRRRIDHIIDTGLHLPHRAEAAIRAWSSTDADVHAVQAEVDRQRHEFTRQSALEILHDERLAELFASGAVYLLIGYEQSTLPDDRAGLEWLVTQLLDAFDSGRYSVDSRASRIDAIDKVENRVGDQHRIVDHRHVSDTP
jgi:AcrR family transcriptional regulator